MASGYEPVEGLTIGTFVGLLTSNEELLRELDTKWNDAALWDLFGLRRYFSAEDLATVGNKIKKFYFKDKPVSFETRQDLYNFVSDIFGNYALKKSVENAASRGETVYLYQFSYLGRKTFLELVMRTPNMDKCL